MTLESKGNNSVDHATKQTVLTPIKPTSPVYSDQEIHIAQERGYSKMHRTGLLIMKEKIFIPKNNQWKVIQGLHQAADLGKKVTEVTKTFLRKIVPRFGLPWSLKSNNRLCFITQIQKKDLQNLIDLDILTAVKRGPELDDCLLTGSNGYMALICVYGFPQAG